MCVSCSIIRAIKGADIGHAEPVPILKDSQSRTDPLEPEAPPQSGCGRRCTTRMAQALRAGTARLRDLNSWNGNDALTRPELGIHGDPSLREASSVLCAANRSCCGGLITCHSAREVTDTRCTGRSDRHGVCDPPRRSGSILASPGVGCGGHRENGCFVRGRLDAEAACHLEQHG